MEIKLSTPLRNKTRGLCGPINGNGNAIYEAGASLQAFADLARIDIIGGNLYILCYSKIMIIKEIDNKYFLWFLLN